MFPQFGAYLVETAFTPMQTDVEAAKDMGYEMEEDVAINTEAEEAIPDLAEMEMDSPFTHSETSTHLTGSAPAIALYHSSDHYNQQTPLPVNTEAEEANLQYRWRILKTLKVIVNFKHLVHAYAQRIMPC